MRIKLLISNFLLYIIIIFISYTALNKFLDINSFQSNIYKTSLFPQPFVPYISYLAILIEITSIVLLIFNYKKGLIFTVCMFIFFTLYISVLQFLDKYEICGCGGILNGLPYISHLSINVLLILITLFILNNSTKYENK